MSLWKKHKGFGGFLLELNSFEDYISILSERIRRMESKISTLKNETELLIEEYPNVEDFESVLNKIENMMDELNELKIRIGNMLSRIESIKDEKSEEIIEEITELIGQEINNLENKLDKIEIALEDIEEEKDTIMGDIED